MPAANAPEEIEVQWALNHVSQFLFRRADSTRRKQRFREIYPQLEELYKKIWQVDEPPNMLKSKHTASSEDASLSQFAEKTMIPTSLMLAAFVWGIQRPRRTQDDIDRTIEHLVAFWSLTFASIKEGICQVVRDDGVRYRFVINPSNQISFLQCLFSKEVRLLLQKEWQSLATCTPRPPWMSADDLSAASVIEVLVLTLVMDNDYISPVAFALLRSFAKCVDQMSRCFQDCSISEQATYKNRTYFSASLERRKEQCAHFLMRVNDTCQI